MTDTIATTDSSTPPTSARAPLAGERADRIGGVVAGSTAAAKSCGQLPPVPAPRPDRRMRSTLPPPESVRSLDILLTEDNAVNRRVAQRILRKAGHQVAVADNGARAVELLEHADFDVVLMDVQMPEMDGFEATAAIRAKEERTGRHLLIIAMTAHALNGDRERCLAAGMDGYIAKPMHSSELLAVLATIPRRRPAAATADSTFPSHTNDADRHSIVDSHFPGDAPCTV